MRLGLRVGQGYYLVLELRLEIALTRSWAVSHHDPGPGPCTATVTLTQNSLAALPHNPQREGDPSIIPSRLGARS